jgi:formylglycine-generating enzyme required for sulfatase activity
MSNDPVVDVSWYGAVAYCNWRSQQEGKQPCYNLSTWACDFSKNGYRLPTEAEWEYAARGGLSGKRFPWGDIITHGQANYHSYWGVGKPLQMINHFMQLMGAHREPYHPCESYDHNPTSGCHPTWKDWIEPYTSPVGSFPDNSYGLYDMVGNVCEWCNDWYSDTYYSTSPINNPTGPITGNNRVGRGGCWMHEAYRNRVTKRFSSPPYNGSIYGGFRVVLGPN